MSTNELQALFANLKPKARESPTPSQSPHNANRSTTNSNGHASYFAGASPLPSSPPPPFSSALNMASQGKTATPPAPGSSNTAQSLLNLLNFGASAAPSATNVPGTSSTPAAPEKSEEKSQETSTNKFAGQGSSISASDLLAKFMNPPSAESRATMHSPFNLEDQGGGGKHLPPPTSRDASQNALLQLLNKAHPVGPTTSRENPSDDMQNQASESNIEAKSVDTKPSQTDSPMRLFGEASSADPNSVDTLKTETKPPAQAPPLFSYTNPFEALNASLNASRSQTPKAGASVPIPSHLDNAQQSGDSGSDQPWELKSRKASVEQVSRRKILTPRLPSATKQSTPSREVSVSGPDRVKENVDAAQGTASQSKSVEAEQEPEEETPGAREDVTKHDKIPKELLTADTQADGGDEWEDTEGSPNKEFSARSVPVYNFPIKPFVSITLQLNEQSKVGIRDDGVMEISRLKKEFDQLDRSLAAATSKYITYALVKNGGMRIIRQDDGNDRQVFKNSHDRIFNVALCTASSTGAPSEEQAVLGTGVSGAVYYATISKEGNDFFEKNELDSESIVFPPYPPADENTAGGVLKTRAKRSSRHPEFFAIGRGKAIHLVWPATAMSPRYGVTEDNRRVDVDKFFQDRALQISTGKAGKDFIFSEDDTLIVSLDKTGRLRFWDIRKLTDESSAVAGRVAGMTVDMPLLSLSTASPTEKSWPTSVLFVDKARPYAKGGALRYVLVGLRQNHTLQLWDIALGKAVQELNFPHENETDGICSVSYHANSGIIVVGHPTRNSLFFIHLSAPRYTLGSSVSQAAYVQRIAMKDPELPKPESTACMSGIREISFADKGQLRSVELLPIHRSSEAHKAVDEKTPIFELYVVHSKGVTCLSITKEDLGWNSDSKVIHGIDAAKEGYLGLKELRLGSVIEEGPRSKSPVEEPQSSSKASKKKTVKKGALTADHTEPGPTEAQEAPRSVGLQPYDVEPLAEIANGETQTVKESKKNKKKSAQTGETHLPEKLAALAVSPSKALAATDLPLRGADAAAVDENQPPPPSSTFLQSTPDADVANKSEPVKVGISGDWLDKELKKVERAVSAEFRKELNVLHQNIQNDRVVQDSSAIARQEALLRLVSTTLTNNVEKALSRILSAQMHQSMIPALTGVTVQAVSSQVGEAVSTSLHSLVPHALGVHLPAAIETAMKSPQMSRTISDMISQKISKLIESQMTDIFQKQVVPAFKNLAVSAAEKAASDVEARLRNEIRQLESDRRNDMSRLEKLGEVLQTTAETLQQMSDTQVAFQGQILKDRRQLALLGEGSGSAVSGQVSTARITPSPRGTASPQIQRPKTKEELELEEISKLMNEGRYEEGSIKWLQSTQPVELFDKLFINFTPEYLSTDVSPLIAFSIAVTIGNSLTTNTARRLEWISAAFNAVDLSVSSCSGPLWHSADTSFFQDPEIADLAQHAPALLTSLITKLERLYMTIAERDPTDPALQIMPAVSKRAKDMRASLMGPAGHGLASQGFEY